MATGGSSLNSQKRREHFLDGADRKLSGKCQAGQLGYVPIPELITKASEME